MDKSQKIIISVAALIMALGGLLLIGQPDENANSENPTLPSNHDLQAFENFYDFGTISMAKGLVNHDYKLKNTSDGALEIDKIYTSCMCTEAILLIASKQFGPFGMPGHDVIPSVKQNLNPGEEAEVKAIFDPAAHGPSGVGPISRSIIIEFKNHDPLELKFSANVTP